MGRVIGDGHIYLYLQDVILLPEHRKQGIGNAKMKRIEEFLDKSAPKNAFIGLISAADVSGFYKKYAY